MRLLIVSQYFPPETGAPQARLSELARRFRDGGHEVTVLTAMPNYPTGRVFDGYRGKLYEAETLDGLRVIRTWIYPSSSTRPLPRLFSYVSFLVSSVLLGSWGVGKHDVLLLESPPLFLVPAGLFLGWRSGARVILNVSDIWPDVLVRMGKIGRGARLWMMERLESLGYHRADVVALTNPGAARQIEERFPGVRTTVISNGVDTDLFRPERRSPEVRRFLGAADEDFLVGYCGLLGMAQGLEVALDAADRLRDRPDIRFVLVGDGPLAGSLRSRAAEMGLDALSFIDRQPRERMPGIVASFDASMVPLVARLPGTMPSKFYEALASGVPPLVAKGCEAEGLTETFQVGGAFEPGSGEELADLIRRLADAPQAVRGMRDRCRKLSARFDRGVIADRTEGIMEAIANGRRDLPPVHW